MSNRVVTIRPTIAPDDMASLVDFARGVQYDGAPIVDRVLFTFSAPVGGWIYLTMTVGGHVVNWELSDILDTFALAQADSSQNYQTTFIHWLEEIASGESSALAVDMEGTVGALVASGTRSSPVVTLSAVATPGGLEAVVNIDRFLLVRDIYAALIAYWEGDALNSAWFEWSKLPKWSLRSSILDKYLG